jgi:alpha-tubulin suppressor-like RCC1 family protein
MPHFRPTRTRTLALALGVGFLLVTSCDSNDPTSPLQVQAALEAAMAKVDVCHRTTSGSFTKITIADAAYDTHLAHGDGVVGGPVPGMEGYGFDDQCQLEPRGFAVGPAGALLTALNGAVLLDVAESAVTTEIVITIEPVIDELEDVDVMPGAIFEFGPSPYSFEAPVALTIRFDAAVLPSGVAAAELRMLKLVDDAWVQIPGSTVDVAASQVVAPLEGFSRYAVGRGKVRGVAVTPLVASVFVGATQQFEAMVTNVDGEEMSRNVQWSSSDAGVATVDGDGLVTALALGEATIEARAGNVSGQAAFMVEALAMVTRIEVAPATGSTGVGGTQQFVATVYDQYNEVMAGGNVIWTSSDETVATIDGDGLATGVGAGEATITASAEGVVGAAALAVTADAPIVTATVTGGGEHSCGLDAAGKAYCWGRNTDGQLGDGTNTNRTTPVAVSTAETFISIIAGGFYTVALTAGGQAFAWGANSDGQLGDGTTTSTNVPVAVSHANTFTAIDAGARHTVALTPEGDAFAWGFNFFGQLGDGTTTNRNAPVAVSTPRTFTTIATGDNHTVALTSDGDALAWGYNYYGQLGDGTTTSRSTPGAVSTAQTFSAIVAGGFHTGALTAAGQAFAWGRNDSGQLGDGTWTNRSNPVAVSTARSFTAIAAGGAHTLALTSEHVPFAWGHNYYGQLGLGTSGFTSQAVPRSISTQETFTSIRAGAIHSLALTAEGQAYGWGWNRSGQVGDGTRTDRHTPVAVSAVSPSGTD